MPDKPNILITGAVGDAARLIHAILQSELPGFRIFVPAVSNRCADLTSQELITLFYPEVPTGTTNLVDYSNITEDTGSEPLDV